MKFVFYIDEFTNLPHFSKHNVTETEIFEFFQTIKRIEISRKDGSFEGFGRLGSTRNLQVAYRKKPGEIFVITAYDIENPEILMQLEEFYENNR